ncbi:MAG: FAD-binding oxidoreductase [Proteobacteria bacterium]|jgi:glycolate oxidase|nr:FAD-binding oxidoreductase [Pseudomonadota bacterium]
MGIEDAVYVSLQKIVGKEFVSNREEELYIYSRDPGACQSGKVDYLVVPRTVEEVQEVVKLAGSKEIPIVPLGGGLNLSGLTVPFNGGIVLDMKRMDDIIEVNESSRYVLIEAGVTLGKLIYYLRKTHPDLRYSVPDAPPMATIAGNALFYGSGHLSRYGAHSEMINGLEVVLPTGEICRLGSCAVSPSWFSRSPLPDLISLFINWFGTTGVVTKLSLRLYPRHRIRDMLIFKIQNPDTIPDAIQRITATEMMEDVLIFATMPKGSKVIMTFLLLYVTADSEKEFDFKQSIFKEMFEGSKILNVPKEIFPAKLRNEFMLEPKHGIEDPADAKKGGGFDYVGANLPLDQVPGAYRRGVEIAHKYGFNGPLYTIRNIGIGQGVIFTFIYSFNRADEESLENSRKALIETTDMVLDVGGVPWKPSIDEQQRIIKKMDPVTFDLMKKIRGLLDPNGIMNPGNWEIQ